MKTRRILRLIALLLACSFVLACAAPKGSAPPAAEPPEKELSGTSLPADIPPTTEPSIQIHYARNDGDYESWGFWIWPQGGEGQLFKMNYADDFGGVAVYPLSAFGPSAELDGIGIIPRKLDSWTKDCDADRLVSFSDYALDENQYYHLYLTQGDVTLYMNSELSQAPQITQAYFASGKQIVVLTTVGISHVSVYEDGALLGEDEVNGANGCRFSFPAGREVSLDRTYEVEVSFTEGGGSRRAVGFSSLYATEEFDDAYYYDGELGALYTAEETTFRVWSPVSRRIELNIYLDGDGDAPPVLQVPMTKGDKGVFTHTLAGDQAPLYYTYTVYNYQYPDGREIVDPYAKSAGLSGIRGQIVDFAATNPPGWENVRPIAYDPKELVVWETHVADLTSSKSWTGTERNRRRYLGMCESGTSYTQDGVTVKTGFDHIVELGVNAVQILPFFDQANDEGKLAFNWGYNPLNYNVLEGSYSSDPRDGYARVREFKQLVQAFNEAGINIIMDVVYNHVNAAEGSNFDVLMPGYYFRYTDTGAASNGSGCGNETASEHSMYRKFMIDSALFFAAEYKIAGYRFDLMGVHDIDTMNALAAALKERNPHIVVYGEPWTGGAVALDAERQAVQRNALSLNGIGQFNDQMRDALIRGGLSADAELGWVTNTADVNEQDVEKILYGLGGVTFAENVIIRDPNQTVNYVTCHDNYTLYDRIMAAGIGDAETARRMAMLANAVVLSSNGTAFMLAGEEFLRTKGGSDNSYNASYEVNELDYALKIQHLEMFNSYQALIQLKRSLSGLHLNEDELDGQYAATATHGGAVLDISLYDEDTGRSYRILHANGTVKDVQVDLSGYTLVLSTFGEAMLSESTLLRPYETLVAYRHD